MKYLLFDRIRSIFAKILCPQKCILCGQETDSGSPLCGACLSDKLVSAAVKLSDTGGNRDRCGICGRSLVSAFELCTDCRNTPFFTAIDRILPLYPYTSEGQELLGAWKTGGMRGLSSSFARCVAAALSANLFFVDIPLVPVPPRPGKIRNKGWDQVEELASILEQHFGCTICRCLERTTGIQQKKLGKFQRSRNIKGHIIVRNGCRVPETAIVLDDVMTTGATLDSCAEALKIAGCRKVYGLTLFYD